MSDLPGWMPSDDELRAIVFHCFAMNQSRSEDPINDLRETIREAVGRALAEQEAHHRREVIEARIDTLTAHGDCVCPLYSVYGERLSAVDPECVVCSELKRLEGELAALEEKP